MMIDQSDLIYSAILVRITIKKNAHPSFKKNVHLKVKRKIRYLF